MPESFKMIIVLTAISGLAGLGLSAMNNLTEPLVKENIRLFTLASINTVMPDSKTPDPCKKSAPSFNNSPDSDAICVDGAIVYRGRSGENITGLAIKTIGDNAYSGTITVLVGLRMSDGMLMGYKVLNHAETPGLGTGMTKCEFKKQMVGQKPDDINWSVAKDGGDIDQLSGATITTRSVINAIEKAQKIWSSNKELISAGAPLTGGATCDGN